MFSKKKCPRCNDSIKNSYEFCPSCGKQIKQLDKHEFGMFGKNDFIEEQNNFQNPFLGGVTGGIIGKMLGSTMKMLEKELQKDMQNNSKNLSTNIGNTKFELFINGKRISPQNIRVTKNPIQAQEKKVQKTKKIYLPYNELKGFTELPRTEPKTSIRRLSDSIVYDMKLPGVKTEKDISIQKIGEVIEIKAIAKNKAYSKTITINLPVIGYEFSKENLILELEAKN